LFVRGVATLATWQQIVDFVGCMFDSP